MYYAEGSPSALKEHCGVLGLFDGLCSVERASLEGERALLGLHMIMMLYVQCVFLFRMKISYSNPAPFSFLLSNQWPGAYDDEGCINGH